MRVFLLDLWLDLREKRLAPVALGLLAALLLVPLALSKGEPEPPPPPPTAATADGADLPEVKLSEDGKLDSRLESFDPRDPFDPVSAARVPTAGTGAAGGGGSDTSGGSGGGTTTTGGGEPQPATGDSGGGTTTTPGDTGTGTGGGTTGTTERRTVFFTYTADVLFGEFGEERNFRGIRRLRILPNEENPVVVFLGVTTSGKTAVFLVDSSLEASGEGACRPSRDDCSFLYLRDEADRNTALLTAEDGTVYRLTLRDIDRVAIGASGDGADDDRSARGDDAPAFTGSTRDDAPPGEPEEEGDGSEDGDKAEKKSSFRGPQFADDARR